jgi:small subunit ribosomal protein S16
MALKIRLSRIGSTHQPHYRIVVAETRSRRDGDPVETLGTYDPRTKAKQVNLKLDRVDYWIGKGAKPSDTLHSMIKRARRGITSAPTAAKAAAPAAAPETVPAPAS